jgi:hypothetical protein
MTHGSTMTVTTLAAALWAGAAFAQNTPSGSAAQQSPHTTTMTEASSKAPTSNPRAVAELESARVTLARIVEHSMSQDARDALASLSTDFRDLYQGYLGHDLPPWKGGPPPAAKSTSPREWQAAYTSLIGVVTRMVGGAPVGTSGTSAAGAAQNGNRASGIAGIPDPAKQDLQLFRSQIERFHREATSAATQPAKR